MTGTILEKDGTLKLQIIEDHFEFLQRSKGPN